jgi:hypothetical protein
LNSPRTFIYLNPEFLFGQKPNNSRLTATKLRITKQA